MSEGRARLRERFLAASEWCDASVQPMSQDASFRRYFRLHGNTGSALLMDAPPQHENLSSFLEITKLLQSLGIRVPSTDSVDAVNGFLILEDLGDATFTRLLATGKEEEAVLYIQAARVLASLHGKSSHMKTPVADYDSDVMLEEVRLFTDWFLPAVDIEPSGAARKSFEAIWKATFLDLPILAPVLVLRDFHLDNLMLVDGQCAVLDYQDALVGSPAYDLVSLVADARRDIDSRVRDAAMDAYFSRCGFTRDNDFERHMVFWGAQRHCKVIGIFTRLWKRDDKPLYLRNLPRLFRLLGSDLAQPELEELRSWFMEFAGEFMRFPDASGRLHENLIDRPPTSTIIET